MSLTGLKKPQLTWEVSIIASMHILTDQEVKAQRSQVHFPDATAYKWQCWDVVPESRHLVAHSHFFPFIPHLLYPPTKWLNPFIFDATSAHPLHEQLWCLHPTLHFSKHAHSCQPLRLSEKPRDVCCSGPIRWPGGWHAEHLLKPSQTNCDHLELGLCVLFPLCVDYHDLFFFFK